MPVRALVIASFLVLVLVACRWGGGDGGATSPEWGAREGEPTPVFVIVVDTLRADHLSSYGYPRTTTPNIDSFARGATVFTNAISASSWTLPSYASILLGKLAFNHDMNLVESVGLTERILPALLKDKGYTTETIQTNALIPRLDGEFDERHHIFPDGGDTVIAPDPLPRTIDRANSCEMDEKAVDIAIASLREGLPGTPFFFMGLIGPHWLYCPQEDYFLSFYEDALYLQSEEVEGTADIQDDFLCYSDLPASIQPYVEEPGSADGCFTGSRIHEAAYDSEISVTDREVGRLFDELRAMGMFDKSMIVVTADHGENMADHTLYFSHGEEPYNSKIHVPLIVKLPYQRTGSVIGDYVRNLDIMPTVFDALGIAIPSGIDARSLIPYIEGEEVSYDDRPAISLLRRYDGTEVVSIFGGGFKLMRGNKLKALFDLKKDPGEQNNIAVEHPETVQALEDLLNRYYPSAP